MLKLRKKNYVASNSKKYLNEIYQPSGVRFGILAKRGKDLVQTSQMFKCRDFFSDALISVRKKKSSTIYGFEYNPANNFSKGRFRFLVEYPNGDPSRCIIAARRLVRKIEQDASIPRCLVFATKKSKIFIVDAPSFWCKSPILMSLLTFLFRQGYNIINSNLPTKPKDLFSRKTYDNAICDIEADRDIFQHMLDYDKILNIIKGREEIIKETNEFMDLIDIEDCGQLNDFHEHSGIASFLEGSFKRKLNEYKGGK